MNLLFNKKYCNQIFPAISLFMFILKHDIVGLGLLLLPISEGLSFDILFLLKTISFLLQTILPLNFPHRISLVLIMTKKSIKSFL